MLDLPKLKLALGVPFGAVRTLTAAVRPSLGRLRSLPRLQLTDGSSAESTAAPEGRPRRRSRWILLAAGALAVSGAATAAVVAFAPWPPPVAPKVAERPAPPPPLREQIRRLRIVGEQLNLQTRSIGDKTFVYGSTPAGLQAAMSFVQDSPVSVRPQVVSLSEVARGIGRLFRDNGFDVSDESITLDLLAVNLCVKVPTPLLPLQQDLATRIRRALQSVPALAPIQVVLTVEENRKPFLLATLIGEPHSVAFTVDGPRAIGDTVLDHFVVRKVMQDQIELTERSATSAEGVMLTVPLHGASQLQFATGGGTLPDFRNALLN